MNRKKLYAALIFFFAMFVSLSALPFTETARVSAAASLSAPSLKKIEATTTGPKLTWGKVPGASGYSVYRKSGKGSFQKIATVSKAATVSYVDKTAKSGTIYYYTVRAHQGSKMSSYNKTGLRLLYLSAPANTKITTGNGYVNVTWKATTGAKGYYIYRKAPGKAYTRIAAVSSKSRSYIDRTATGGGRFTYAVAAYSGSFTSSRFAKTCTLPKAPSTPKLGKLSLLSDGLKLTWSRTSGAAGYEIYRKTGKGAYTKLATVGASTLSYTDKNVTKGKSYTYTVRAYAKGVRSEYNKTGLTQTFATYQSISNTTSKYSIEADVTLSGSGTGYHAKLVACTPTSAVSFGLQYDKFGVAPYTDKTTFMVENVYSNAAGGQQYIRTGLAERNQQFHLMLSVLSDGTCNFYVDGVKVGSAKNPQIAKETVYLRVEASGRKNGDSVKATFKNIELKGSGKYDSSKVWRTYNFDTNDGMKSDTSKFDSLKAITISGKVTGLRPDQDWDNAYEDVSGIIQFIE